MGSIPVGTNKFTGTYQKPESSYSVMVSTADFESVNLGSNPSKSLTMVEQKECFQTAIFKTIIQFETTETAFLRYRLGG